MLKYLLKQKDKSFLEKSENVNQEDMLSWKLPNLIYPVVVILFSLISFLLFKDKENKTFVAFINLLLNGSLPMMALNRLSSLGVNLFKFDLGKEKKNFKNTYNLRLTIHYYSMALVFGIALFYVFQVINIPFDLSWTILLQIVIAIFCIHQSLAVSKYAFLLQEKLMDMTFDNEIRNEIEEKGHSKTWDE
jgi:hypothetical protein